MLPRLLSTVRAPVLAAALVLGSTTAQDPLNDQERAFQSMLSGATLTGKFTVHGQEDRAPQEESYRIGRVEKLRRENEWLVEAVIRYAGKPPARVPVAVQVEWAGDTPMIQVTDLGIPGMGTFTARVGFYDDLYFGMWSGADHGGHMFGRVVRAEAGGTSESGGEDASKRPALHWPTWRGPRGTGEAPGANPPLRWSETENVAWKIALPGLGHGTPIVLGNRLYLTVAVPTGEHGEPVGEPIERRDSRDAPPVLVPPPTEIHSFRVLAVDRASGEVVWSKEATESVPHEVLHATASQASASIVSDGERLYVSFGSRGLFAFDLDGVLLWSVDLGEMRTRNQFGEGSSPAVYGDTLVVNWDHEGSDFLVALDKRTGEERWRQERDEPTTWSTPVIAEVGGKPQVIVAATNRSVAYDLATGDEIWSLSGLSLNVIPTPIVVDGKALLMSNFRGSRVQAISLRDARGDLSSSENVAWESADGNASYVPSALVHDGLYYMLRQSAGVLSCLRVASGEPIYEGKRLRLREVYASPIEAAGRIYVVSRDGITKVVRAGEEFEILATNELEDGFSASPVAVGRDLYLRGEKFLYCLREDG
jgi:outer membrane protein assembly factor BamB